MKKLEIGGLRNLKEWEREILKLFKDFDLENISTLNIIPGGIENAYYTLFLFETKTNHEIQFYYKKNEKINAINIAKDGTLIGSIELNKYGKDEKTQKWLDDIWNQFIDHFNLRIRLMFINESTPWKWNTYFTY